LQYYVKVNVSPFTLKVYRKKTDELIWDTSLGKIVLGDLYTTYSTSLPSLDLFGLGERW